MGKSVFSRRQFLLSSAAAAAGSAVANRIVLDPEPLYASPRTFAPSDRVRFGIVGVGMEGTGLLTTAVALPGVDCVAACDLYDGRHELAKEIAGKSIYTTRRYKELLDNKEIDAIIVAVPDHWHKQVVVDAVTAGKDVYCEKPMSHRPADGVAMVQAAKKTDQIVQIARSGPVRCYARRPRNSTIAEPSENSAWWKRPLAATIPRALGSTHHLPIYLPKM